MKKKVNSPKKPVAFFKETLQELKKASWPSKEETTRLTIIVIVVSLAVAGIVGGLDFGFTKLMEFLIKN
ncbi:preprotein translocase subunit SecE [Patescibacteria group bacterium]